MLGFESGQNDVQKFLNNDIVDYEAQENKRYLIFLQGLLESISNLFITNFSVSLRLYCCSS